MPVRVKDRSLCKHEIAGVAEVISGDATTNIFTDVAVVVQVAGSGLVTVTVFVELYAVELVSTNKSRDAHSFIKVYKGAVTLTQLDMLT